jgi:hypothetical protein
MQRNAAKRIGLHHDKDMAHKEPETVFADRIKKLMEQSNMCESYGIMPKNGSMFVLMYLLYNKENKLPLLFLFPLSYCF